MDMGAADVSHHLLRVVPRPTPTPIPVLVLALLALYSSLLVLRWDPVDVPIGSVDGGAPGSWGGKCARLDPIDPISAHTAFPRTEMT